MKKRIFKRVAAVTMALALVLGLFAVPEFNAYAEEDLPTGLKELEVEIKDVSEEEFNEIDLESQKADAETFVEKCYKGTDSFWSQFSSPYYNYSFSKLNTNQRNLYNELYNKLFALIDGGATLTKQNGYYMTPAVAFTGLSNQEALNVAYLLMYDAPELYYLSEYVGVFQNSTSGEKVIRIGVYDGMQTGTQRANCASTIKSKVNWYLSQISTGASAYDKEKKIHDLLCSNCYYGNSNTPYNQSCASVFLNAGGKTVCAGYSEAFALLCYARGIPAMSITSSGHEWNQVKIGNYWYAVDVTWDDANSAGYKYFNKSDNTMIKLDRTSHTIESLWSTVGRESCPYDYGSEPASGGSTWYNGVNYSAVYDYDYYINTYGDLKNAFGSDSNAAIAHFVNCGMNEGRQAKSTFNVQSYRNQYQDLRLAFGWNNLPAYYNHYRTAGIYEGRNGTGCTSLQNPIHVFWGTDLSPIYDYNHYNQYTDLRNAFGGDDMAMMTHFLSCGMNEGRRGNAGFDVYSYRNQYSDLRQAFGWNNLNAYYSHYLNSGRREGRAGTGCNTLQNPIHTFFGVDFSPVYDYEYYKSHNADLRMAFGDNDMDYFAHFLTNGMNEGRQASAGFNVWTYASNYADLRNVFGWNLSGYYLHYLSNGIKEGRKAI